MKKYILILIILFISVQIFSYSYGKNKIQSSKLKWSKIETLHFDIYFQKGENQFGKTVALIAEEAYYYIKQDFKTPIKNRIPVIFYKSHQEFETTNIIFPLLSEAVGGFTETARNRIAVPFDGSYKKMEEIFVHELTHAYINELNKSRNRFLNLTGFPFWFQEGLPEFEAVGGEDVYNNMFVIDMLINEGIGDLSMIGGFFAYRLGESFLVFVEEEYGRDTVVELFYALRYNSTADVAFKKVFGMEFKDIQLQWKNHLKRKYYPYFADFDILYEVCERKTDHKDDGSFLNFAPRFSPDGNDFLYFSNKNIRTDIWKGSTLGLYKSEKILNGETSGKFEEFHFQRNNISWFPDGERFAFVSKTSFGDRIYVMNFKSGEIVYTFSFPEFDAIYEIDVSKDGKKIVFAGQKDLKNDIYVYEIETGKITQITNDHYYDNQPRWSPDDKKIVFASARTINESAKRDQVFSKLTGDIFYYDLEENVFYSVTDDKQNNSFPFWNSDGSKILFVSEQEITTNFEVIDILTGQRAQVTNVHGGVFTGDISANDDELIFSGYYNGGWDVYLRSNPLDDLEYVDYKIPERFEFKDDFYEKFDISRYKVFGKTGRKFKKELPEYSPSVTKIDIGSFTKIDSMNQRYNIELDKKPTEILEPLIKPYKTRFALDYLWGGVAYSPSGGTYAQIQFGLSDLMGNHSLGINLGISGDLDTSDLILNYLYLAHRIDYGVGCFYLNDEWVYKVIYPDESPSDYFREREREFGIYTILRYPFNKFWRVDFENLFYKNIIKRDWWDDRDGKWLEEYLPQFMQDPPNNLSVKETELVCAPQITFVHDNAIYGSVGPVSGWRGALLFNRSFSTTKSYSVVFSDIRNYLFFEKRYSLAFRLLEGAIIGDTNQRFVMDFFSGVRGYNKEIEGKKKFLSSIELRFPFIDNFKLAFPLPLYFYQIRGSIFIDIGSVWENNKDLRFYENDRLKDLKLGIGFGPRLNMGYFVLKFDIAWHTDLYDFSKPSYYISLAPDF